MFKITPSKLTLIVITMIAILLASCNALPTPTSSSPHPEDLGPIYTQAALTVVADLTHNAPPTTEPTSPPTPMISNFHRFRMPHSPKV